MYPPFVVSPKGMAKRDGNVTLPPGKGVPLRGRASVRATDAAPPRINSTNFLQKKSKLFVTK